MLFNSYVFIFAFLPVSFLLYFYVQHLQKPYLAQAVLVGASLFFYGWWNLKYIPLILFSLLFNYQVGTYLQNRSLGEKRKKRVLIFGFVINIGLLGFFKYTDFILGNLNTLFRSNFDLMHLLLPLAISFFTFQQIAYLVDSYKNRVRDNTFMSYALFVTFFPQLIAGPIVHHNEMMPQFSRAGKDTLNYENISKGIFIFAIGIFKKVFIADTFAEWSDLGFGNPYELNMLEAWVASLSFGFQLYFDFSGYADMAIGLALLFNIKLPVNFRSPYKAASIQEFWQRWHITLSHFLRDYVSLPLKKQGVRLRVNIVLTFLVSGIWHGAGWTFVIWGILHGTALVIQDIWKGIGFKLSVLTAWLLTFVFLTVTRVFFRSENVTDAMHILYTMFRGNIVLPQEWEERFGFLSDYGATFGAYLQHLQTDAAALIALVGAFVLILLFKNSVEMMDSMKPDRKTMLFIAVLLVLSFTHLDKEKEFYYFIF